MESPTKARTISRFLGKDFVVDSSFGHIRDLPSSKLGVDVEHNFEPQYLIPLKARATVKKLKAEAEKSDKIILATDEDREGESIAWHLEQALDLDGKGKSSKKKKTVPQEKKLVERIVFHEITKRAIEDALKHPRKIDLKLVDAQQARRILDRLVGYKLSPFLWKKFYRGLSAGRVQSVAVRLIVEREREIEKFKPEEYWSISAILSKLGDAKNKFETHLYKKGEKIYEKLEIKNDQDAKNILADLKGAKWMVAGVEKRAVTRNPLPPFTTSTLQQAAFQRIGSSAKQTMRLAQQLYEGVELDEGHVGLITYMRTDSLNLSEDSLREAKDFIKNIFGDKYLLSAPRKFKTKSKGAQEAHEAIRPTDPARTPESIKQFLDPKQFKLYDLIWKRFMATQMPSAIFDGLTIDADARLEKEKGNYTFRATGQVLKFDGFLKVYPVKFAEVNLPDLKKDEKLELLEIKPDQHFTEPPPRFSEASLIKILEKNGIGRPSTYAPTISTVQDRGYVQKNDKRQLAPTEIGFKVNDLLVEHFPKVVDIQFTAKMEGELDDVAEGKVEWQKLIGDFYHPFAKNLEEKYGEVKNQTVIEETNEKCDKCGKPMIIRTGRFGRFMACSGFPDCKNTKAIKQEPQTIGLKCPKCTEGDIIMKRTRRGKVFFGCSRYPDCDYASWTDPRNPPEPKKIEKKEE